MKILSKNKEKLLLDKDELNNKIKCLETDFNKKYPKAIIVEKDAIKNIENQINDYENKKEIHKDNIEKIEKYQEYIKSYNAYKNIENKIGNLENEEKNLRKKLSSIKILESKIKQAESMAIINFINKINMHTQVYLDKFFENDPIYVELLPFKERKKQEKKAEINLAINYKGMECDLNMLSGGELQRVILAFFLALAEIFNSPILLLDECTSNLDQEITTTIINTIKNSYAGNFTILIAHQVVKGIFDKVISLN